MHTPKLFAAISFALSISVSLAHPLIERANPDLASILAALKDNSPDDAAAAATLSKRDELSDIIAALAENSPDDAAAAKSASTTTKRDEVDDIIAALAANSPDDAAAAKSQEAA